VAYYGVVLAERKVLHYLPSAGVASHEHAEINLSGHRVLVTGGARGLGEACARLVGAGATVVFGDVLHARCGRGRELGRATCPWT
jgi:hypothetical protein